MAIDKKLIFWKKQSTFNAPSSTTDTTGSVMWYSIVFFKDTGQIWTNGTYYNCGVWGTPATNYVPLTIGGTTYNLSRDGHTHAYLPLAGGVLTSGLEIQNTINGTLYAYNGGGYHSAYNNLILRGNETTGTSGILFTSSKGTTSINQTSDRAFIQYHPYGITPVAEGSTPTIGTSGEAGKLVIGIGNDNDDMVYLQTPSTTGLKHLVGADIYTILDTGNYTSILDSRYRPMTGTWSGNNVPGTREFGFRTNDGNGEVAFKSNSGTMNMIIDGEIYCTDSSYKVWHAGNLNPTNFEYEAYLKWGGKDFSGSYGCIDAAMVPFLGANRLAFANASGITIEYSRDSGVTWLDYGASDSQKLNLTSGAGGAGLVIGKADSTNKDDGTYQLRITFDTSTCGIYTQLNKFCIYLSTNGSAGVTCTIDGALQASPDSYTTFKDSIPVGGWSGYNIINTSSFTTYGNTPASQYGRLRFTFKSTGGSTTYNGLNLQNIFGYGGVGWVTPSNMARWGQIYSYNSSQEVTFPAKVTATSFSGNATSATKVTSILTRGTYLIGNNFDGSAATTWAVDATSTNTASKVVARDGSGNFSAGTITATLSGNASTASAVAWSGVSGKPTTLGNYGITDALFSEQVSIAQTDDTWVKGYVAGKKQALVYNNSGVEWGYLFNFRYDGNYGSVLSTSYSSNTLKMLTRNNGTWGSWVTFWHSGNANLATVDWTAKNLNISGLSTSPKILINKVSNVASGISWYSSSYTAWQDYMANSGTTGNGINANITAPSGTLVTGWGKRSFIENNAGFGWTFESGTNSTTTPSVVAEIRSSDGAAKFNGVVTSAGFTRVGSDNTYVLLGGGSHKLISDFTASLVTSTTTNGTSNVVTGNTNTYLNVVQGGASTGSSTQITGTGTVTVSSDASGKITINGDLNADTLDGYHAKGNGSGNETWGYIPIVGLDGTMQVGRYLDFNHSSGIGSDYNARLHTNGVTDGELYINSNKIWHAGNLTNVSQLTNNAGYITSSGSITGNAGTVTITADPTSNAERYILFANSTSGANSIKAASGFRFNPYSGKITSSGIILTSTASDSILSAGGCMISGNYYLDNNKTYFQKLTNGSYYTLIKYGNDDVCYISQNASDVAIRSNNSTTITTNSSTFTIGSALVTSTVNIQAPRLNGNLNGDIVKTNPQLSAATENNEITIVNNAGGAITTNSPISGASIRSAINFRWYSTNWQIGNIRSSDTNTQGFGITSGNNVLCFRVTSSTTYVYGNLSVSGSGTFTGGGFNSLRELKNIHEDWKGSAIETINQFKVRDFNYKNQSNINRTLGFIIDEIPSGIAEYVLMGEKKDSVNLYSLHALSFKAHQETKSEIDLLKLRIQELETKIKILENGVK